MFLSGTYKMVGNLFLNE